VSRRVCLFRASRSLSECLCSVLLIDADRCFLRSDVFAVLSMYSSLKSCISVVCVNAMLPVNEGGRNPNGLLLSFSACYLNMEPKHEKRPFVGYSHAEQNVKTQKSSEYTPE
jgi:hypothetical protein